LRSLAGTIGDACPVCQQDSLAIAKLPAVSAASREAEIETGLKPVLRQEDDNKLAL
jgi:hypothetical protein